MSHDGNSNFVIEDLDTTLAPIDVAVNTIGTYDGTVLLSRTSDALHPLHYRYLKVTADGNWTIQLLEVSDLPRFDDTGSSGHGDAVLVYTGAGGVFALTHNGSSNFVVTATGTDGSPNNIVNEIGSYSGNVPIQAGPAIVSIEADGNWSIVHG